MNLFGNEIINITNIRMVNLYKSEEKNIKKHTKHYPVTLSTYELIFYITGKNSTHFAGKVMEDLPNSVRYLPKGIKDGKYSVEIFSESVCIDIYFDTADPMPDFAMNLKNMNELKPLFEKIYAIWNSKKTGYYAESMSIFYEIIKKIKIHNAKYYTNEQARKIIPSYDYMLEHFTENDFNYKEMCAQSGLSYDYFKELFIKKYNISPVKYITALRIERAKELLITGRFSVTEIAQMCGFDNVYYFSNVFKKHTGVSPKNYKP